MLINILSNTGTVNKFILNGSFIYFSVHIHIGKMFQKVDTDNKILSGYIVKSLLFLIDNR